MADDYALPKAVDFANLSKKAQAAVVYKGRIIQPKWDGCALIVRATPDDVQAISATGKPVTSCNHLVSEIMCAVYKSPGRARSFTACAEVWNPDMEFQEISGAFRRQKHQPHLVARWFDFAFDDEQHLPYVERTSWMANVEGLHFAGDTLCADEADAWRYARHAKSLGGFDGAILRNPNAPFTPGRSKGDIIKLKPLMSLDLECIGVETAVGEKTGRPTVALVVKLGEKLQRVATGLNHEQQANPDQFIGQIIEVEAMGRTKDGLLREPRFKGARHDKLWADA